MELVDIADLKSASVWSTGSSPVPGTTDQFMIIFDLSCDKNHRFEGWFRSAEDFESQIERRMVCCPQCDSHEVRRIPSAVAIATHADSPSAKPVQASANAHAPAVMLPGGAEVMAMYQRFVDAVMSSSEDVGRDFAEEARKIHYNEAPERLIRGQASADECEALREEGIEILSLPVITKDEREH